MIRFAAAFPAGLAAVTSINFSTTRCSLVFFVTGDKIFFWISWERKMFPRLFGVHFQFYPLILWLCQNSH